MVPHLKPPLCIIVHGNTYPGMKVRMNQNSLRIKSMGICTVNVPGFQEAVGPWRGIGAVPLLGGQGAPEGGVPSGRRPLAGYRGSTPVGR